MAAHLREQGAGGLRTAMPKFRLDQPKLGLVVLVAANRLLELEDAFGEQRSAHCVRSPRNSDPGAMALTISRSRARVQAT